MCLLARFVLKIRFAALHPRDSSDLFLHLGGLALAFPRSPDNIVILTILFLKQPTSSAYPNCILTGCPSNDSAWEFFGTSCWIVVLKLPPGCEKSFALPWEPRLVFFSGFYLQTLWPGGEGKPEAGGLPLMHSVHESLHLELPDSMGRICP